ncbi:O-antigen ligase family protein [Halochromatium glycolicum]|uniref:O-antigen ligase family protein n=1 Tax=Halochromatium glycolicum TaxID=85075 RepID=UPI00190DAA67|nr:O-antigen ligase family protein [Halochromatium glycolicum]
MIGIAAGLAAVTLSIKAVLLAVGLTAITALLILPWGAYYLVLFSIPFWVPIGAGLSVARLALVGGLGLMAFNAVQSRGPWLVISRWPDAVIGLAFTFAIGASVIMSESVGESAAEAGSWGIMLLYYFFTLTFVRTPEDLHKVGLFMIGLGLLQAAVVALQIHVGLVFSVGDITHEEEWAAGSARMPGTTGHSTVLAGFLQIPIIYAFAMLTRERRPLALSAYGLATAAMVFAWYHTYSRTSLVAFAIMAGVALMIRYRFVRMLAILSMIIAAIVLASYEFAIYELVSDAERQFKFMAALTKYSAGLEWAETLRWRLEQWTAGWRLFLDHIWFGTGPGLAGSKLFPYLPAESRYSEFVIITVHNSFFHVASEVGIFALVAYTMMWLMGFRWGIVGLGRSETRFQAQIWLIALSGQLVVNIFNPAMREPFLVVALLACIARMAQATPSQPAVSDASSTPRYKSNVA